MARRPNERHECKYVLTEEAARAVLSDAGPWIVPDAHAAKRPDHTYRISSVYLDSPTLRLYRETMEGQRSRFKLRIRCYSDAPEAPVFLEIKRRLDRVVRKNRCTVSRGLASRILRAEVTPTEALSPEQTAVFDEFVGLSRIIGADPRLVVRYDRAAYVGAFDSSLRVTFDRRLRVIEADDSVLDHPMEGFAPVEARFVVLELKFNNRCPAWMSDLVRRHMLQRSNFSKYCKSVDRVREMAGHQAAL